MRGRLAEGEAGRGWMTKGRAGRSWSCCKRRRTQTQQPSADGDPATTWDSETWLAPLEAHISGIRLDEMATLWTATHETGSVLTCQIR